MGVDQMPSVLILSDSHGLTRELKDIKERHQLQYMIHCGDSELDYRAHEMDDLVKIAGNCDFDPHYPDEETIKINGITFFITHGHLYNVKTNLMKLAYRSVELNAQVVCFGHTHIAMAEQYNELLFINPGSIRLPKIRPEKTYVIMEWESTEDIHVNFYTLDGEKIKSLSRKLSL